MAITPFLAMTAAEMYRASPLPEKIAWMACHFSPYGLGLSNLPKELPPNSLLIVDDITPPHGHDPVFIAEQLEECVEKFRCRGVLLDFQRADCEETAAIASHLITALSCPMILSECYAQGMDCPVFLAPVPPSVSLEEYLTPWQGREIWLELGLDGEILALTEQGCETTVLPYPDMTATGFSDEKLCCHYSIAANEKAARFTLWRTKEDWDILSEQAKILGVNGLIGLYQEITTLLRSSQTN